MPPVNLLLKPASSSCNMNCRYCFYHDVAEHREQAFQGMLTESSLEKIIVSAFDYADHLCSFTFQGGEPTLAGLDFFQRAVELQKMHNQKGLNVRNNIQTNGLLIDDSWAKFFKENNFLVGLSLDGPADLHNENRCDHQGKGSWQQVMRAAQLFQKHGVDFNILCVVTGNNARFIEKIYRFYRRQDFRWLQFIPCLEPIEQERGVAPYHLARGQYGDFLVRIFRLWLDDLRDGNYISIRHIDNWLSMLMGEPPEACNMSGRCSVQFVIEGDGGVYPCDFYVLDQWKIGVAGEQSFAEMRESAAANRFVEQSFPLPESCRLCRYGVLCRNGCLRDRTRFDERGREVEAGEQEHCGKSVQRNYYCDAYRRFFGECEAELAEALRLIRGYRAQNALRPR
ncbi:MAG: anaerobic sulfatase maturase [Bacillota bacterium]|nr:anaerobic sulfatase maturase [Bacillota bacterium]